MTSTCGLLAALDATPRRDCCPRREPAFQYFVPADQAAALVRKERLDVLIEPSLQLSLRLQPLRLHQGLALAAVRPSSALRFIAANVDKLAWKYIQHLSQDVLHERNGVGVANAQHVVLHAPSRADLEGAASAGIFRICRKHREQMTGHLDLRHNG